MSILCDSSKGWVLDHAHFIKKTYCNINMDLNAKSFFELKSRNLMFNEDLFKIVTPFRYDLEAESYAILKKKLKRKRLHSEFTVSPLKNSCKELTVRSALEELVVLAEEKGHFTFRPCEKDFTKNNQDARDCTAVFFNEVCQEKFMKCNGGNTANEPVLVNIGGQPYLIPENSKFFCCDLQTLNLSKDIKFDFILLDPPWWNKYVRRRKSKQDTGGYKMMYNEAICSLPVMSWLAPLALVAVWCTNCDRHRQDIVTKWFPKWGLIHVASWYWIKVTQSGDPVCQFSTGNGKQPYEQILFGAPAERQDRLPPDNMCIISVPSAIHSHKPPLCEVMSKYLPIQPRCLELFARYLLPSWTSAGDQVLSLQNLKLYTNS